MIKMKQRTPFILRSNGKKTKWFIVIVFNLVCFAFVLAVAAYIYTKLIKKKKIQMFMELLVNQTKNVKASSEMPITPLAYLDEKYSNWSITEEAKTAMWNAVQMSPINQKTGRHYILYSIANMGMIPFILNSICSMKLVGIPREYHVAIALDWESYVALSQVNVSVVFLNTSKFVKKAVNNVKIINFYDIIKVKPTILHQFLLWNVEPILVDADTVFLENPLNLFNDEADFEVQCDSKVFYQIPSGELPVPWQVNLGFYKVLPSPAVLKLAPIWLERMYNSPKAHDQSTLRKILKTYPTNWLNNDTVIVDTSLLFGNDFPNLTFRFLDPIYVANAGGLYQEGMNDWIKEAKRREIKRPKFIHFFHIGRNSEKEYEMKRNNLWFVNRQQMCVDEQPSGAKDFPLWS